MIGKAVDGRTAAAKDGRTTVGIIMIDKAITGKAIKLQLTSIAKLSKCLKNVLGE